MVTAVKAGNLQVDMSLNSAAFKSEVKKTMGSIDKAANAAAAGLRVAGTAVVGFLSVVSVATISRAALDFLRFAGAISDTARTLGLTTKELQGYRYAAAQSGVATTDLESGVEKLQQKLGLALSGAGQDAGMFKALGIDLTDASGKARSSSDVFGDVADRLAGIEDPAQRSAAAAKVFGEDVGPKLLPLLAQGSKGMDDLRSSAEQLGLVLAEGDIQKADEAAKKVDTLQQVLQMKIANTVAENANSILSLAGSITSLAIAAVKFAATDMERIKEISGVLAGAYAGSRIGGLPGAVAGAAAGGYMAAGGQRRGSSVIFDRANNGVFGWAKGAAAVLGSSRQELLAAGRADALLQNLRGTTDLYASGALSRPAASGSGTGRGAVDLEALLGNRPDRKLAAAMAVKAAKPAKDLFDPEDARAEQFAEVASRLTQAADVYAGSISKIKLDMDDIAKVSAQAGDVLMNRLKDAEDFARGISSNLAQGIVYGKNIGEALINSFKAAAAEAIANGLFDLMRGAGSAGGWFGTAISSVGKFLSGGKANGGYVAPGSRWLVGERGPEIFETPGTGGTIHSNAWFGRLANDNQRGADRVVVDVQPSPLFATTVTLAGEQGGSRAAARTIKRATSGRMATSRGA